MKNTTVLESLTKILTPRTDVLSYRKMNPVFMVVLYKKGDNPYDSGAEWRQIVVRTESWPPLPPFFIEEYSGTKKERKGPDTASFDSASSFDDAIKECRRIVSQLEDEGFEVFNPFLVSSER